MKRFLITTSAILFFLAGFVLSCLIWPQILVNEKTLGWAAARLQSQGIHIQWKNVSVKTFSYSLLKKKIEIQAADLCFEIDDPKISGCTPSFALGFSGSLENFSAKLLEIGPISISNLDWNVLLESNKKISGNLILEGISYQTKELQVPNKGNFKVLGKAKLPDQSEVNLDADLEVKQKDLQLKKISYQALVQYTQKKSKLNAELYGKFGWNLFQAHFSVLAQNWLTKIPRAELKNCDLSITRKDGHKEARLQFQCPANLRVPIPPEPFKSLRFPTTVGITVKTDFQMSSFIPSGDTRIEGPLDVILDPILSPIISGEGQARVHLAGILQDFPENWKTDTDLQMKMNISHFEKLVRQLENSAWSIPAPAHVLHGPFALTLEGKTHLNSGRFPIQVKSELSSKDQRVYLDGLGNFNLKVEKKKIQPDLDFELILSQIQLQLPYLNFANPPRLIPDERIRKKEPKVESASLPFRYRIRIHTPGDRPAIILSNLAKAPIPVHVDLTLTDSEPLKGKIKLDSFPMEFFKRDASIQYLTLNLTSPSRDSPLDGLIQVKYVDYTLYVKLMNTLDKPVMKLISDPPLPENQLYSALLFGRPLGDLDPEQSAAVMDTKVAVTDGAIGLISLFALASTPIQSVGYDPSTKVFSAKVRLAEGTSLNVGTSTEHFKSSKVGIRKRLNRFWSVETDVTHSAETGQTASAYLEWSHRY